MKWNGLLKENHMRLYLDDYVQNDLYYCRENREKYLNLMRENAEAGFSFAEGSKFDCFDIEIAEATFEAFKEADNYKKSRYIESFKRTWMDRNIIATIQKYNLKESLEGLCTLYSSLEKLEEQYDEKVFAKLYTHAFLETVDTCRKEIEKTN